MSGSGKAGNGRGNNRKRPFRRRNRDNNTSGWGHPAGTSDNLQASSKKSPNENQGRQNRGGFPRKGGENPRREKAPFFERPKWTPPKINTDPLPSPDCPWCGKVIRDIALAITDRDTGSPVHFECVTARIAAGEHLEKGDTVTYIGGGRFGVVNFDSSDVNKPRINESKNHGPKVNESMVRRSHDFKIKKVIEWENSDDKAEWRLKICDHYSVT